MATSTPLMDIGVDPLDERRRRALLRIGIPLGGVALMIATILCIAFYADRANRDGAMAVSNDLLAERNERKLSWVSTKEGVALVEEPGIMPLLLRLMELGDDLANPAHQSLV